MGTKAWIYWNHREDTIDGPDAIRKKAVSFFTEDTRRAYIAKGYEFERLYSQAELIKLLEDAFTEGYWSKATYNDMEVSDGNDAWNAAKEGFLNNAG